MQLPSNPRVSLTIRENEQQTARGIPGDGDVHPRLELPVKIEQHCYASSENKLSWLKSDFMV